MKVAIIGAGPSGLACALELENHGLSPVIFEQRHRPGDLFDHCAAVLELFTRPYDPVYSIKKLGLDIAPIERINTIIMKSEHRRVSVRGKLGYLFIRGGDQASVESQLFRRLKSGIISNTKIFYADISPQYDYVVVADGCSNMSRTEGVWSPVLSTKLVGCTVVGEFDRSALYFWVDTKYCKTGYAYLAPMEKKRAFLGLVIPESSVDEARERWKLFWKLERLPYDQVNEVIVEHNAGFVYPHQLGNIIFIGKAGGFLEPFLGFGLIPALKSGVMAARAIAQGKKYEELLAQLIEDMKHSLILRDTINKFDNKKFDRLLRLLSTPGVKQLIYNSNIDFIRILSAAISHYKKITNN